MNGISEQLLGQMLGQLIRIADALEQIARSGEPAEPNIFKPLAEYGSFDWSQIGATVVHQDQDGPTHLEWGGQLWTRRSPSNKFDPAVWFSRSAGKDEDGNVRYLRLITFREIGEAEPLPAKARQKTTAVAVQPIAVQGPAKPDHESVSTETAPAGDPEPYFEIRPRGPKDYTTFYGISVPAFLDQDGKQLDKVQAADILKSQNGDAVKAFGVLVKEFRQETAAS